MITKCNYCDYQKSTPMPENLLKVAYTEPEDSEDRALWMERLVITMGFSDYHSVKIHMGRKHKALVQKNESPRGIFEEHEIKIMESIEK